MRVNVYRDLLALTNQYASAWDTWRDSTVPSKVLDPAICIAVDQLVALTEAADVGADRIARLKEIASANQVTPWQS